MNAALFVDFPAESTAKKCQNCGSNDRVKTVQIVRKGGKRKITVQKRLCIRCRQRHGG